MARLLHAIKLYEEERFTEAMSLLLKVEEDIHELPHPYFKGVAQFYIARIYLHEDLYKNSLSHFKKELEYSKETEDSALIAKAENHVSVLFCRLEENDSCLYHIRRALAYGKDYDSVEMANIHNNQAVILKRYYPDSTAQIEFHLLKALGYSGNHNPHVMANLAELYYRLGRDSEGDSLAQIAINDSVAELNTIMIMSRTLYKHYEEKGLVDSAYKYHKLYLSYDSIVNNLTEQKDIVKTTEEHVSKRNIDKYRLSLKHQRGIVILLVLSVIVIFFFLYRTKYMFRREKTVLKHTLEQVKSEQESAEKYSVELENTIKKKDQKNEALKSDIKERTRTLDLLKQLSSVVICKLLEQKSGCSNITIYYDMLYDELVKRQKNKSFINDIQKTVPEIKRREEVICLLLFMEYKNEKICEIIDLEPGAYRTAKSRLKAKLLKSCDKSKTIDWFLKTYF